MPQHALRTALLAACLVSAVGAGQTPPTPSPALLVLNKTDATLAIVNPATNEVVAKIATGDGPHEVVVSDDGALAFVANYGGAQGAGRTISVIDLATRKELRRVDVSPLTRPHGLAYHAGKLYFTAEANQLFARYDPKTDKIEAQFPTGQQTTHMVLISPDGRHLFTSNIRGNTVSIFDRGTADGEWTNGSAVGVGMGPEGFDVSPDGRELWSAHSQDGGVSIIDVASRKVVATLDLGTKRSNRLKFTRDGARVLVTDLDAGELLVIDARARKVVTRVPIGRMVEGILMSPDGTTAYVAAAGEDFVAVVDLKTLTIRGRIQPGAGPDGMAWVERQRGGGAPAQSATAGLWKDATAQTIGETAGWTNKVEIADINGDGRPDILFANGGNYSDPGTPEANIAFINNGPGKPFTNTSAQVFGPTADLARVIKARDLNGDGITDILVGTTYQTQSRLYLGTGLGQFTEVTATHLPKWLGSVGNLEVGDADGDGDLDVVLADWGAGNNMSNAGGRTRLWLNDGTAHFTDTTDARMPDVLVRFSWDLEFGDVDNDDDLDVLVSCKRCPGGYLFRNDGTGKFVDDPRAMPQYTNNYEYELMDLDGDGFLDIVTMNDGEILKEQSANRREHVFHNDGKGRFRDATAQWWPPESNVGEDDNMVAFLDFDSDGDADFVVGSLSGPDRLLINDGKGHLTVALDVFSGPDTPGTLGIALADLDGDGRMDVVQAQGEDPKAVQERVFFGTGLKPDTAPPSVSRLSAKPLAAGGVTVRARVHDRKSPLLGTEFREVVVEWTSPAGPQRTPMRWTGEYLWRADMPAAFKGDTAYKVCATDAAGNAACAGSQK